MNESTYMLRCDDNRNL